MLALAHVGNGVYELMCGRTSAAPAPYRPGPPPETVRFVAAPAQPEVGGADIAPPQEEETAVYRRGRNAHVHGVPQHASVAEYHAATALRRCSAAVSPGGAARLNELFCQNDGGG
jgi:ribonuclease-3 family protein